jgi:BirA family biotin operon repressor/biotin-[acetyl-CoA-carboxylase] ligase
MNPSIYRSAWPVIRFDTIDSTNEEARRRAERGDYGPIWLTAAEQTAGRGRQGRSWSSPRGNLFATALFHFDGGIRHAPLICFIAGLAVIDAAERCGVDTSGFRLKWPNDVLSGDAKLAGILIETGATPQGLFVAAGFGVNVATAPVRDDRRTACLRQAPGGALLAAEDYMPALDGAFRDRLAEFAAGGFAASRDAWMRRAAYLGETVVTHAQAAPVSGVMLGLAEDGALLLRLVDGAVASVRAGEIEVLG